MTKTQNDLRDAVARILGKLSEGQTLSSYNKTRIDEVITAQHEYLKTREIAYWELSAIPLDVYIALRNFMAATLAPEFGDDKGDPEAFEKQLVRLTATRWNGNPTTQDRF